MYYPYDYPSDYYYTPYNLYDYGTGCIRPNSSADLSTFYNTFPYSTSYDQPHPTSYPSFASKNQTKPQELPY